MIGDEMMNSEERAARSMSSMVPYYERDGITIYVGDNREVLPHIGPVHAVVTDPPYGLTANKKGGTGVKSINLDSPYGRSRIGTGNGVGGFMGKQWDGTGVERDPELWQAISAAMLPGAHLLSFGGARTSHRMAVAIEDAGYEIRDTLMWLYGSGFPKSHDVSKAIDKMAGAEREVVGSAPMRMPQAQAAGWGNPGVDTFRDERRGTVETLITAPATPEAEQWQGWGTALKPAYEPIIMARKPFKGTVAANVLQHGTGALNIDACRIPGQPERTRFDPAKHSHDGWRMNATGAETAANASPSGRWPANVILDEVAAEALDEQSGERKSGGKVLGTEPSKAGSNGIYGTYQRVENVPYFDTGGASRFFYVPKASRRERSRGLPEGETNSHPTVKPLALMRYLIQMITPPEGTVLDPFAGSGSTLVAAAELGLHAIGIELSEEYAEIAARRVEHALNERAKGATDGRR